MIRIDEIYTNVFAKHILTKQNNGMHYFDPFGCTNKEALCCLPKELEVAKKRFLFWDQEPFYPDLHLEVVEWFYKTFWVEYQNADIHFITSEKDSKHIKEYSKKFGFNIDYYFFHAWASLDWYRGYNRTFIIPDYKQREIKNTFISPNRVVGGNRYHRVELFKQMVSNELHNDNLISFPKYCPYSKMEVNIPNVSLPLVFEGEDPNNIPNESYKISLWNNVKNCFLYVVTETVYEQETLHLTEKIFKPIVMQMPFVLVGAKNNLEYLRSYGFKTFGEFWDESYDSMDNNERINAVTKLLVDLNSLSLKEKAQLQKHITPVVEHNFNWFYSREYENLLWKELTTMIKAW